MALRYQVAAVTGKYEDRDGKEKSRYVNIGSVMDTKNGGLLLKLDAIPLNWDGFAYLNEPREQGERPASSERSAGRGEERSQRGYNDAPQRGSNERAAAPQRQTEPFPEDDIPF